MQRESATSSTLTVNAFCPGSTLLMAAAARRPADGSSALSNDRDDCFIFDVLDALRLLDVLEALFFTLARDRDAPRFPRTRPCSSDDDDASSISSSSDEDEDTASL
jgi:hypothetical protein